MSMMARPQHDLHNSRKWLLVATLALMIGTGGYILYRGQGPLRGLSREQQDLLTKKVLARAIDASGSSLPTELSLDLHGKPEKVLVRYAFDRDFQAVMEGNFDYFKPDYGAFVALDAQTGRVLTMVSYSKNEEYNQNLSLRATFPSASVFKVVTAAAAIEQKNFSAHTVIPFTGGDHTLYRRNLMQKQPTRWTRYITLKEAFARSINTVFGKIGAFTVGAAELKEYAERFGFNRRIIADVPLQDARAPIVDDAWALAESASGYTRETTMSPVHGALIAAAIANDGVMMEPYMVESVRGLEGEIYRAEPRVARTAVDAATAEELRTLMRATVTRGTSRGSFRRFFRGEFADVDVGGKTGSLTGTDPAGKYDWFVGFAAKDGQRIAFASMVVHEKYWRVKAAHLARLGIEHYFGTEALRARGLNSMAEAGDTVKGMSSAPARSTRPGL